jgi:DNA-binding beta-propeller fold protein YncE
MRFPEETINSIFTIILIKMKHQFAKIALFSLMLSGFLFSSCDKTQETPDTGKYGLGVLISNEGTFGAGNGSISYYDTEGDSVINEIFQLENNRSLGDVVQSVIRIGDYAFIQVNNSNKIEIVDGKSFAEVGVLQNITQVRYAIGDENQAYATAWGTWGADGKVYFIDVKTLRVTDSVSTGNGPEALLLFGENLFVANSGGWGLDNTISIISTTNKILLKTLTVGSNPKSLVLDKNNKLWILCSGSTIYDANWMPSGHHPSTLVQVNPITMVVEKEIPLFADQHPSKIAINPAGDKLYIGGGFGFSGIYTFGINEVSFTSNKLINNSFYGFDVNQEDGNIFAYESLNFTERGKLYIYSESGVEKGTYTVGIAPNGSSLKRK